MLHRNRYMTWDSFDLFKFGYKKIHRIKRQLQKLITILNVFSIERK